MKKDNYQLVAQSEIHEINDADKHKLLPSSICSEHASNPYAEDLQTLPIDSLKKLLVTELKSFIHCCIYDNTIILKNQLSRILLLKGKVIESEGGAINLLVVAFKVRELQVNLPRDGYGEEGNVLLDDDDELFDDGI